LIENIIAVLIDLAMDAMQERSDHRRETRVISRSPQKARAAVLQVPSIRSHLGRVGSKFHPQRARETSFLPGVMTKGVSALVGIVVKRKRWISRPQSQIEGEMNQITPIVVKRTQVLQNAWTMRETAHYLHHRGLTLAGLIVTRKFGPHAITVDLEREEADVPPRNMNMICVAIFRFTEERAIIDDEVHTLARTAIGVLRLQGIMIARFTEERAIMDMDEAHVFHLTRSDHRGIVRP
jgi:hypothetical protein